MSPKTKREKEMKRVTIKKAAIFTGIFVVLFAMGVAFAQDAVPAVATDAPAAVPVDTPSEVPSADNPLPDGWVDVIPSFDIIWKSFQSTWYVGAALILFLFGAFLRGKLRLAGWVVKIPKLSEWFNGAGSKVKFWLIIGFTGVGMALVSLTGVENWVATEIIKNLLSGLAGGVVIALAAMGVNTAKQVYMDPKHPTEKQLKKLESKKNG